MTGKTDAGAATIAKVPLLLFPIILYSMVLLTSVFVAISIKLAPFGDVPSWLAWLFASGRAAMTSYTLAGLLAAGMLWSWAARGGFTERIVPFAKPRARYWLWAVVALAVEWALYSPVDSLISSWGISMHGIATEGHGPPLYHYPASFALMTVYGVVVGPTCEEILFRGFGIGYLLARGVNRWLAGAIIALLFLLMHWPIFGLGTTLTILPIAILLSVLRIISGNLTPGIIMHVLNNILAFLVLPMFST